MLPDGVTRLHRRPDFGNWHLSEGQGAGVTGRGVTTIWDEQFTLTPDAVLELARRLKSADTKGVEDDGNTSVTK